MDRSTYWKTLVKRVHTDREILATPEDSFWRLSCIYGETMVDGVEAYLERRYGDYEADLRALNDAGFSDVANDIQAARLVMLGGAEPSEQRMNEVCDRLLDEKSADAHIQAQLGRIYRRLIERLEDVYDYNHRYGIQHGLFDDEA